MSEPAHSDDDPVLIRLRASTARRAMAVAILCAFGGLLAWLGATQPAAPLWRLALGAVGVLAVWSAVGIWRATRAGLVLTAGGLREDDGRLLAALDEIVSVDRGIFAFKPSNGFALRLATRSPPGWSPGIWWRLGRRLGVGGVTASREAKMMADALSVLVAQRDGRP